jgi:RNA polymerase sigma-70 factor (ECF subfamily)
MSDGQASDAEIIRRCRQGEVEPYRLLVERYQDRIYNLSLRLLENAEDARDAAQETFVRAFAALSRFEPDQPFAPWLYRIATNACYGVLRKRKRSVLSLDSLAEWEVDAALAYATGPVDPQEAFLRTAREEEIQAAVMALPVPFRTVVLLRYMEGLSYDAIAKALDKPLGTVKTYLHRAHLRLRAALADPPVDKG